LPLKKNTHTQIWNKPNPNAHSLILSQLQNPFFDPFSILCGESDLWSCKFEKQEATRLTSTAIDNVQNNFQPVFQHLLSVVLARRKTFALTKAKVSLIL